VYLHHNGANKVIHDVTGIVLAGGKSSRMQTEKAFIRAGGRTFIQQTVEKMQEIFERVFIVSTEQEKFESCCVSIIPDIYPERGPLGGIHAALSASKSEWIFVVPCDVPLWEPEIVAEMMLHTKNCDAVVPIFEGKYETLFALYRKTSLPVIENSLLQKRGKIIDIYPKLNTAFIDLQDYGFERDRLFKNFFNVNTPEDLSNFKKL
jgi:molybdopterin-guanine dinucleotide biosynthesis protein A